MFKFITLYRLIPSLGKRKALRIARQHCMPALDEFRHHDDVNGRAPCIYAKPTEPCWIVHAPWMDGLDGKCFRSSRIIMISKRTGKVLYDGSANDEG